VDLRIRYVEGKAVKTQRYYDTIPHTFHLILPAWNQERWIANGIESVMRQTYSDWQIDFIDDLSTDRTLEIARRYKSDLGNKLKITVNQRHKEAVENIATCIHNSDWGAGTVIGILDGDDWFCNDHAFEITMGWHKEYDVVFSPSEVHEKNRVPRSENIVRGMPVGKRLPRNRRKERWNLAQFRTFKKYLFMAIEEADLRNGQGEYFLYPYDTAIMYPIIELAGWGRIGFGDEILYVNNRAAERHCNQLNKKEMMHNKRIIRSRTPSYQVLP